MKRLAFDDLRLFARGQPGHFEIAIRTSDKLPDQQIARRIGSLGRALYAVPAYLSRAGTPEHPDDLRRHRPITNSAATQLNQWPFVVDGASLKLSADGRWRALPAPG